MDPECGTLPKPSSNLLRFDPPISDSSSSSPSCPKGNFLFLAFGSLPIFARFEPLNPLSFSLSSVFLFLEFKDEDEGAGSVIV